MPKQCLCKYIPEIMERITELENVVYGKEEEQDSDFSEIEQKIQQKEDELNKRAENNQKKNQALTQIALKLKEQIELINKYEEQQKEEVKLPTQEEVNKVQEQIEGLQKLLAATNTYFGGIYDAIKEPLKLEDIPKEDEPIIVMKGLENIVQGVSRKLSELQ